MVNLGVIGCGDVAFRSYLPGLVSIAGEARVVACFDVRLERAQRAAALFESARAYGDLSELLAHEGLQAVINLTPAPLHGEVNAAALEAGLHVYSEKPLANSVEEARALIEQARRADRKLLSAPGVMVTGRFRWIKQLLESGRLGRPTLATAQIAGMGPAAWRSYTGDPAVFYGASVGPLVDTGVYLLHAITGLLGPARRVQAFGGIAIPQRTSHVSGSEGQTIAVETNDHMLLHLDLGENTFAQVLSSFAVPRSKAPVMEVHCTDGSVSIGPAQWYDGNGPTDVYLRDDSELGVDGWMPGVTPTQSVQLSDMVAAGAAHFVACLAGKEEPKLTAEHACHVLEIMLKSQQSVREGRALEIETRF